MNCKLQSATNGKCIHLFYNLNKTQTHISTQWTGTYVSMNWKNFRDEKIKTREYQRNWMKQNTTTTHNSIEDIILHFYSLQKKTFEMDSSLFFIASVVFIWSAEYRQKPQPSCNWNVYIYEMRNAVIAPYVCDAACNKTVNTHVLLLLLNQTE